MAKYEVTETAYIGGRILTAGDKVDVPDSTIPGPHMLPLDAAAKAAVKAAGAKMTAVDPLAGLTAQPSAVDPKVAALEKTVEALQQQLAGLTAPPAG